MGHSVRGGVARRLAFAFAGAQQLSPRGDDLTSSCIPGGYTRSRNKEKAFEIALECSLIIQVLN
jgi:hypothetical protein